MPRASFATLARQGCPATSDDFLNFKKLSVSSTRRCVAIELIRLSARSFSTDALPASSRFCIRSASLGDGVSPDGCSVRLERLQDAADRFLFGDLEIDELLEHRVGHFGLRRSAEQQRQRAVGRRVSDVLLSGVRRTLGPVLAEMSTALSPGLLATSRSRREENGGSSAGSIRMGALGALEWSERTENRVVPSATSSAASAVGSHALIGNPHPLWRLAALPEHVDRHAAAWEPIAADSEPSRLEQSDQVLADADGAILVEGAVIAEALKVKLQRLRFDDPCAGA